MASVVKIKRSSVSGKSPNTSNITTGELALNVTDGKLFSTDGSSVFEVGANLSSLNVSTSATISNANITGTLSVGTGGNSFEFPASDGNSNQILVTDGSGSLTWQNQVAGGNTEQSHTSSSFGAETIYSFNKNSYRGAEILIISTHPSVGAKIQKALVVHDDDSAYITVYSTTGSSGNTGSLSVGIASSNVELKFQASSVDTKIKFTADLITSDGPIALLPEDLMTGTTTVDLLDDSSAIDLLDD